MSDELTDLLRTAAGALDADAPADPTRLIARARRVRRRQRLAGLGVVLAVLLLGAGGLASLGDGKGERLNVAAGPAAAFLPGWTRLADPPLSPRTRATAATVGNEIVVAGGTTRFCFPGAGCVATDDPGLSDGAAFNMVTGTWRSIAPAPMGFGGPAVVVDDALFLFTEVPCALPCFQQTHALLRYRPGVDRWDLIAAPPAVAAHYVLAAANKAVVAYLPAEDVERRPDWIFDVTTSAWHQLPDDPLPLLSERQVVAVGEDLLLFGTRILVEGLLNRPNPVVGARFNGVAETWTPLPTAPGPGYQARRVDSTVVLLPPGDATDGGGLFDVVSGTWDRLPPPPGEAAPAGAFGPTSATYRGAVGPVLDLATRTWTEPLDADARNAAITSFGRRMFRYGGESYAGHQSGLLRGEAWVWTPPSMAVGRRPAPESTAPPQKPAERASTGPETAASTAGSNRGGAGPDLAVAAPPEGRAPDPAASLTHDATAPPRLLSVSGDAATGRLTLRFSRVVLAGQGRSSFCCSPSSLSASRLVVYGPGDTSCSNPKGLGQDYWAPTGTGSDTVTVAATGLSPGANSIVIHHAFVTGAGDGVPNETTACIGIGVTG